MKVTCVHIPNKKNYVQDEYTAEEIGHNYNYYIISYVTVM